MYNISRNLIFVFCILSAPITYVSAQTLSSNSSTTLPHISSTSTPTATTAIAEIEKFETLERVSVKIESSENSGKDFSILNSFKSMMRAVSKTKYFSLLKWRVYDYGSNRKITGYNRREQFGTWINDPNDETCYNTRAKVLIRDAKGEVVFKSQNHCSVESGTWHDPYTNQKYFSTADIQIDHLVPLKNAYMSGAYRWSNKSRCIYANYLGETFHLISVNGHENMKKGDKGPDGYMPPNTAYTCQYLKNWLKVKFLWGLRMKKGEADAIAQLIQIHNCNTKYFYMSSKEIKEQLDFSKNLAICPDQLKKAETPNP